jgi:hypothetical protein
MANTYFFHIEAVDAHVAQDDLENVIYNVHYSYIAQDDNENVVRQIGVQHFPSVDPENFTPIEDLRQADIISWLEEVLPVDEFKVNLDNEIAEKAAPTKVTLQIPE